MYPSLRVPTGGTYLNSRHGGIGSKIVNDNNNDINIKQKEDDMWRIVSPSTTNGRNDNDTTYDGSRLLIPPPASVTAVLHYLRSQLRKAKGNLGVNLLAGGYDTTTSHAILAAIHPHGSIDIVSYSALGSGVSCLVFAYWYWYGERHETQTLLLFVKQSVKK
jgi:hypothetical protein